MYKAALCLAALLTFPAWLAAIAMDGWLAWGIAARFWGGFWGSALCVVAVPLLAIAASVHLFVLLFNARPSFPGHRATPARQPALHGVVEDVSARVGVRVPDEVWLTWGANFEVYDLTLGPIIFGKGYAYLVLGLHGLQRLTIPSFKAVLAHEFHHLSDFRRGVERFLARTHRKLMLSLLPKSGLGLLLVLTPGSLTLLGWLLLHHLAHRRWHADLEREADASAAQAYGAEALAAGLEVAIVEPVIAGFFDARLEADWNQVPPRHEIDGDVARELESLWTPVGRRANLAAAYARFRERVSPALVQRIACVSPEPLDGPPASSLIEDAGAVAADISDRYRASLTGQAEPPAPSA